MVTWPPSSPLTCLACCVVFLPAGHRRGRGRAGAASGTAPDAPAVSASPAVTVVQLRQQAAHHVTAGQAGLTPGETRRDPRHQVIEQARMRRHDLR